MSLTKAKGNRNDVIQYIHPGCQFNVYTLGCTVLFVECKVYTVHGPQTGHIYGAYIAHKGPKLIKMQFTNCDNNILVFFLRKLKLGQARRRNKGKVKWKGTDKNTRTQSQ